MSYYQLNADCRLVTGAAKAAIYDLTRHRIIVFPKHFAPIIESLDGMATDATGFADEHAWTESTVEAVRDRLIAEDVLSIVPWTDRFAPIDETWDAPGIITNAILDIGDVMPDVRSIFIEMGALGCQHIQIRCYVPNMDLGAIRALAAAANDTGLRGLDLLVKHIPELTASALSALLSENMLISRIVVHSAPDATLLENASSAGPNRWLEERFAMFTGQRIDSSACCGTITQKSLSSPTTQVFAETKSWNGCMNRKISVDVEGQIRNCPSFRTSYGRIGQVRLAEVASSDAFRAPWHIRKDDIEVCRDCELRYACTDCRAYTIGDGRLGKPARCAYDPYSGKWGEMPTSNHTGVTGENS